MFTAPTTVQVPNGNEVTGPFPTSWTSPAFYFLVDTPTSTEAVEADDAVTAFVNAVAYAKAA